MSNMTSYNKQFSNIYLENKIVWIRLTWYKINKTLSLVQISNQKHILKIK